MKNKMSSKERMFAALNLEEPDVIPVAPYIGFWFAPKLMGYTISEYVLGTNKLRAEMLLNAQKRFGFDWILAGREHRSIDSNNPIFHRRSNANT